MAKSQTAVKPQSENKKVATYQEVDDILLRINKLNDLLSRVMNPGGKEIHYGKIPGCGNKPTLLKSGAEKINQLLNCRPEYKWARTDYEGNHREYEMECFLYNRANGLLIGHGVGTCSTFEDKYYWRTGEKKFTNKPVPKKYWDVRKSNPKLAQEAIGGVGYSTGKHPDTGQWVITIQGEKEPNKNPANEWNTIFKMAKKRAYVDATITASAASDLFTQDVEDMTHLREIANRKANAAKKTSQTRGQDATGNAENEHVDSEPPYTKDEPPIDIPPEYADGNFHEQYGAYENQEDTQGPPSGTVPSNSKVPVTNEQLRELEELLMEKFDNMNEFSSWLKTATARVDKATGEILSEGFNHIGEIRYVRQLNWVKGLLKRM